MDPERLFFIYAFPCAGILLERENITRERYNSLERLFLENKAPEREELEDTFKAAFRRIKNLANRMNKDYWDFDVIKEYWRHEHNKIIDANDGNYATATPYFKDFCKVHEAKVIEKKEVNNNEILVVKYGDKTRNVFYPHLPDIKVGDTVTIHHAYAVEKLG